MGIIRRVPWSTDILLVGLRRHIGPNGYPAQWRDNSISAHGSFSFGTMWAY